MSHLRLRKQSGPISGIVGNAGALSIATFARLGSLFVLTVLLGRVSGAQSLGYFSVMLAVASMLQAISVGGLAGAAVHRLLKAGSNLAEELAIVSMARLILIPTIFILGTVAYFSITGFDPERLWISCVFFVGYAFGAYDVSELRLTAMGQFSRIGWRRTAVVLLLAGPKFGAAATNQVELAMLIQALEAAAWQAVLLIGGGRAPRTETAFLQRIRVAIRQIWSVRRLWLSGTTATFAQRIDLFVVSALLSLNAAGQYSTASRPVESAVVVAVSLVAVLFNGIVNSSESPVSYSNSVARGARSIFSVAIIMTVFFVICGPFAIQLLYGIEFKEAGSILPLYALSLLFVFQRQFISRILVIEKFYGLSLMSNISSLIVNVILNLWLIPLLGIAGAALAALVTHPISLVIAFLPNQRGRAVLWMSYGPLFLPKKYLVSTAANLIKGRHLGE